MANNKPSKKNQKKLLDYLQSVEKHDFLTQTDNLKNLFNNTNKNNGKTSRK